MIHAPLGYYEVNGKIFFSKMEAFIHASSLVNVKVNYHFHDEIWDIALANYKFNPLTNLETLYKERAQQIRDSYDYLILNFSGGVDSTTILESFLKNNIKLDEIYVRWPKRLINSGKYIADRNNKDATNMLSEWDFSVEPKLEYVRRHHPEIKITIDDWIDDIPKIAIDDNLLFKQNHNFGIVNFTWSEAISSTTMLLGDKGKRVANIVGTDKPSLVYDSVSDKFSMLFYDITIMTSGHQHAHGKADMNDRVNFYYAEDFPELHLARAYAVAHYARNNPETIKLIDWQQRGKLNPAQKSKLNEAFDKIINRVCYPNWDMNTFQVEKPNNSNKIYHPWFHYLYESKEFDDYNKNLLRKLQDFSAGIKDELKNTDDNNNMVGLAFVPTKWFTLNI